MYYGKVELCGVNTSSLPILTAEEKKDLLLKTKNGDMAARDKLISGNLRLVLSIIQRFAGRSESMDDLFQVGCVGLIKAVDNFNVDLDVKFSTYAVPMIIGEVRRYLRDNNVIRVSRSVRELAYRALRYREKIASDTGCEPTPRQIAEALGETESAVSSAMEAISDPISLYDPVYNDGGDSVYVLDQLKDENTLDEVWLENIALREALDKLSDREKTIVDMRYYKGRTQVEIAKEIGISQAQVSRLEKGAMNKIRKQM
ncbi:MAG: RNA polymerase sporulation sigma factor SigG [Clostridia bacterium]|nr:RNA polymerase sporulation sigma factor SigG [Clostridia bacterium]